MALLQQQETIICEGWEGCKATAEARNKQRTDSRGNSVRTLSHTEQNTYYKATNNIHNEGAQREASHNKQMAQSSRSISQAGTDEAAQAC